MLEAFSKEDLCYKGRINIQEVIAVYKINNVTVNVYDKKDIPNRFIRFWQKHILGITWEIYKK